MKNIHHIGVDGNPITPVQAGGQQADPDGRPTQVPPPSVIRPVGQIQQGNVRGNVSQPQHMMQHNGHSGFTHM